MKCMVVFLIVVLSPVEVFTGNFTKETKNEHLLKNLVRSNELKAETRPQGPNDSNSVTTEGVLSIVEGPVLDRNRTLFNLQLSTILEAKQLLRDVGLLPKTRNTLTNTISTTEMKNHSPKNMEVNGKMSAVKGINESLANSREVNEKLARTTQVNKISGKGNASSVSLIGSKIPKYVEKDVTPSNENTDKEIQMFEKFLNMALEQINDGNSESSTRIQATVKNSKDISVTAVETNHNSANAKSLKDNLETTKDNGNTLKVKKDKGKFGKVTEANGNSASSTEVVGNSVKLSEINGESGMVTEVNGKPSSAIESKPWSYSVKDSQNFVPLYKQLLLLALKHINNMEVKTSPLIKNSEEELKKRFIDTLASGLIGRK